MQRNEQVFCRRKHQNKKIKRENIKNENIKREKHRRETFYQKMFSVCPDLLNLFSTFLSLFVIFCIPNRIRPNK